MMRFVSIGECMVELTGAGEDLWRQGFAGDTFNTAWYARRALPADWTVDYHTALGTDPMSDRMVAFMAAAGVGTGTILRHPTRQAGLYMVSLTNGERSFTYWRDSSAARTLADDPAGLDTALAGAGVIYFSGITVAILGDRRAAFLAAVGRARDAGARVAFDPNLRPRLWTDREAMCQGITEAAAAADIVLPSFDDEAAFFGDADPAATARRYRTGRTTEVMVKNGGGPMAFDGPDGADGMSFGPAAEPVDTTGAGDSFNAAYLAARLSGDSMRDAARAGDALARQVILQRGALIRPGAA
ncbi:sugar kinase [Falsirhodobacter halotolerans]|uniref:sugar kinase n=1 Tax=Falsirhodobacter halotolerans TaxID=1146892 RepID=UPI001FD27268|nr:sugar kinase [Falsirhodobacter halotolerans]MCJ8139250.1 sugar kinase [Falsirhodobacter halotolerans]